ncbi:hypothetical protein EV421DRAFT_1747991 [Armillaria borealis]|uniref:F-box domain-containing protein n=1 Tax=Armillaria borealis TaxID=47425 RepID=A0AA39IDE9_9AGAR|nr:hypothetical protein EV421DRAFT_1747991 [Armillaria borealis]
MYFRLSGCLEKETMNNATKRCKIVSDAKENVPPTGSQRKNGRQVKKRLKGALAVFVDMPLDIILCIFELPDPLDLLHLARLSKAFRHVLMPKPPISASAISKKTVTSSQGMHGHAYALHACHHMNLIPTPPSKRVSKGVPEESCLSISKWSSWLSCMQIDKEIETKKLNEDRLQGCRIRQKLVYLGYGAGLIAMPSIDVLAEHNPANKSGLL